MVNEGSNHITSAARFDVDAVELQIIINGRRANRRVQY